MTKSFIFLIVAVAVVGTVAILYFRWKRTSQVQTDPSNTENQQPPMSIPDWIQTQQLYTSAATAFGGPRQARTTGIAYTNNGASL